MKEKLRTLLLIVFVVIFLYAAWQLIAALKVYHQGQSSYDALEQYISFETTESEKAPAESPPSAASPLPDVSAWPQVDFDALSQVNPDIVGWIFIEGTNINYPVVQTTDNDYYLDHLFDGTQNRSGSIFLDFRCSPDFSDRHSIIYGHHMKDKSMFQNLVSYKEQSFYDEHPEALLVTPDAYHRIRLFSGYITDNWSSAWNISFEDNTNFAIWLSDIQGKSSFTPTDTPTAENTIITLSTCTYEFSDAKFVVHGYISETIEKAQFE